MDFEIYKNGKSRGEVQEQGQNLYSNTADESGVFISELVFSLDSYSLLLHM